MERRSALRQKRPLEGHVPEWGRKRSVSLWEAGSGHSPHNRAVPAGESSLFVPPLLSSDVMPDSLPRKIIHVDMDVFYASVEQRDDPNLRGRPVAVGYAANRGVVAAASYEARAFGVRSAMPATTAMRRCPDIVFVPLASRSTVPSRVRYTRSSPTYTSLIEPLSLDEAYLDVMESLRRLPTASAIANGEDDRPVVADRPRKSSGSETTFERDLTEPEAIEAGVQAMADDVWSWCEKANAFGRTVTVKAKFADFQQVTRSRSYRAVMTSHDQLRQASIDLVPSLFPPAKGIRLVGASVSNFAAPSARVGEELPLFEAAGTGGHRANSASERALDGQI
ncbi:MAG: DinB/UmuC family translesion DNA polymerase [Pararhizobium sp.]